MYRLYTEDKNVSEVTAIASKYFTGFTMFLGIGYWKGKPEKSLVIEIEETEADRDYQKIVEHLAMRIKELNKQESVMIVHIQSEFSFV